MSLLLLGAGVGSYGYTAPYTFTANADFITWGSSTTAGDEPTVMSIVTAVGECATGETAYGRSDSLPGSGTFAFANRGNGGENMLDIANRMVAAPAREKAADASIQPTGNFTEAGSPADYVGVHITHTQTAVGVTGLNHSNFVIVPKHADNGAQSSSLDWTRQRDFIDRARALWPGRVQDPGIALRQMTPLTAQDVTDRDEDTHQTSYQSDASHLNTTGQRWRAAYCEGRFALQRQAGFVMVPHQRVYSTEATNQTNGGLVALLEYTGSLTGASFSTDNANFSVVVNGSDLELRRATGTALYDGNYYVTVTVTQGSYSLPTHLVVYLMDLTGARVGRFRVQGQQGTANAGKMANLRGVTTTVGVSFAMGIKVNAGDGTNRRIVQFGGSSSPRGLQVELKTTNVVGFNLYTSSALIESVDSSTNAAQTIRVANGLMWVFGHVDLVAGTSQMVVNENAALTGTCTAGQTCSIAHQVNNTTTHHIFGNGALQNTHTDTEFEAICFWNDAVIDWTVGANRDLVRDISTRATLLHTTRGGDGPGEVNGNPALLWLQGAANVQAGLNLADGNRILDVADRWQLPILNV